jgi:hypothetical protein
MAGIGLTLAAPLAGITDVLADVERRADEVNRRAGELADEWL